MKKETLKQAVYLLWNYDRQVVEGSGAAAVAPVIENKPLFKDKIVVSVVTEGNIDSDLFQSILKVRALANFRVLLFQRGSSVIRILNS